MRLHLFRLLALVGFIACAGLSMGQSFKNTTGCDLDVKYYLRPAGSTSCAFLGANFQTVSTGTVYTFPAPPIGYEYFAVGAKESGSTNAPGFVYNQNIAAGCGSGTVNFTACGATKTLNVFLNTPFNVGAF